MSSLADDINDKIAAGRKTIEDSLDDMPEVDMGKMPAGIVAAGLVAAIVGVGVLGWLVYRKRAGRSLSGRLRDAMPEGITSLPARARARIRR